MPPQTVIALDAMGGDSAPQAILQGAALAHVRHPNVRFLIFGDRVAIEPLVAGEPALADAAEIVHAPERVTASDKPSVALRRRKKSSMRLALDTVAEGRAQAMVSAGNTGALMAMAKLVLRTLPGIDRPAIAGVMPTQRGESVMLDLGANIECDAENLVDFAVMGAIFAQVVLGVRKPTVGLLNVGQEELKGHEEIRQAGQTLKNSTLPFDFHGFVEGDDMPAGTTDVVVTDGFTGNVALKTAEGVSKLYTDFLRRTLRSTVTGRIGYWLAQGAFARIREAVDPRRHNGAMFLGLNGVAIKSHGGTDAWGFANAVDVAVDAVQQGINEAITQQLLALHRQIEAVEEESDTG